MECLKNLPCSSLAAGKADGMEWRSFVSSITPHEAGFDRASRNLGAGPCQGLDAEGSCPLILCNVVHDVLVKT